MFYVFIMFFYKDVSESLDLFMYFIQNRRRGSE